MSPTRTVSPTRAMPPSRIVSIAVITGLLLLTAAAQSGRAGPEAMRGLFGWPLQPRPVVERQFDKPAQDWLPGHRGVDLGGFAGQAVLAAGAGIVVFAGAVAGRPVVSIDHDGGLRTTYEPVEPAVPVGRRVARGTRIGELLAGHPGCAAPACLHWGLRREHGSRPGREYLDPLGLLRIAPLRLKPVADIDGPRRVAPADESRPPR